MHQRHFGRLVIALIALLPCVAADSARAAVTLPPFFSDHMVLQRGMEVPFWGTTPAGEKVSVEYAGKSATATADADGNWSCKLPALAVGEASPLTITASSGEPVVLKDVLVGDVWICSGQSNMQWSVEQSANPQEEIKAATEGNIRVFRVPMVTATQPTRALKGGAWQVCSPEVAGKFTAVGYYFARELRQKENIPIGLVDNSWGGMPVESFMTAEALAADPDFKPILDRKFAAAAGNDPKNKPEAAHHGSSIYNAMVHPLAGYAIKGVIWYQGESNAARAEQYRTLFPAMIEDWRKQWNSPSTGSGQGEFPFLFVQLANWGLWKPRPEQPADSTWAELREAQTMTLKTAANTGMAVIIDIGDTKDIHPKNKQDVGKRLALAAENMVYGKRDVEHFGPMFESYKVEGDKIRVKFAHADGLTARDGKPKSFTIAGEDQKFHWADAEIAGDEIIVSSKGVAKPVAVRYAWEDDPQVNCYNAAGLPMCPFRTDDWKLSTAGAK